MRLVLALVACVLVSVLPGCGDSTSSPSGGRPAAMAGHWRFTDVLSSGALSLVTDIHLVLDADGTCRTWTKHGDGGGDPESSGLWKVEGDRLFLSPPAGGSWQDAGRFTQDGDRMRIVLPNGTVQVFTRL